MTSKVSDQNSQHKKVFSEANYESSSNPENASQSLREQEQRMSQWDSNVQVVRCHMVLGMNDRRCHCICVCVFFCLHVFMCMYECMYVPLNHIIHYSL
jgi:hypothetical protein